MARPTLIVLDRVGSLPRRLWPVPQGRGATLLSLTPKSDHLQALSARLERRCEELEVVHGADHLDRIAKSLREPYVELVASAADDIAVGDTNLRLAFQFENQLSLWWLNEIFGRRSDLYPGFTRVCQVRLIENLLDQKGADTLSLITDDLPFWRVVRELCDRRGLAFLARRPPLIREWLRKTGMPRVLFSSLAWLARASVQTVLARLATPDRGALSAGDSAPLCLFHTIYPSLWKRGEPEIDDKLGDVPTLLDQAGPFRAAYACTFSSDGRHQHVTVRQFWRLCRWLKARRARVGSLPMVLVDAYPRFRDLLAAAAQMKLIFSYSRLERSLSYRRHWQLGETAFHPLLREELRAAMVRTPRYLLHSLRVRRLVEKLRPRCLVFYHLDYGLGRAITFGSLSGSPETTLVGLQEGPIAKLKLWSSYHPGELRFDREARTDLLSAPPVPDLVLLEGTGALDRLTESGYPPDRLRVAGAPRVTRLSELPRWGEGPLRDRGRETGRGRINVLVVFGAHDGNSILEACLPALQLGPRLHLVFKLHPRSDQSKDEVLERLGDPALRRPSEASFSVAEGDVYRLLAETDLVVATYSSVAMEAAALGYPLICLSLSDRLTASPLIDVEAPQVRFVTTPAGLVAALEGHLENEEADSATPSTSLAEYFFYRLDGLASRRWAKAIEDHLEGLGAASPR